MNDLPSDIAELAKSGAFQAATAALAARRDVDPAIAAAAVRRWLAGLEAKPRELVSSSERGIECLQTSSF